MIRFLIFAAVLALLSCNQQQQQSVAQEQPAAAAPATPAVPAKDTFTSGHVIPVVPLRLDANQTFALYLPKGYSDSVKFPAIIFFDPHGDGSLPLVMYHELADKYHFVLLGSNNSKNLVSFEQTSVFSYNLANEAKTRFSVDPNRISFCGFSGGAKVALLSGSYNPLIKTIIYCGAKVDLQPTHPITLLGFAGTRDMNYTDVVDFDNTLKDPLIKHYLIQWNGKHEFPTADVFMDAFTFLTTGKIENYESKRPTISPEKVAQEQSLKKQYMKAFEEQDVTWWTQEIARMNVKAKTDPMYSRLLGFISLACYSYGNTSLRDHELDNAGKILAIYKIADPENKDCDSLTAVYNRMKNGQ
jgi:predicted esterase